ncbi:MAG TPA: cytochrome P450 [Candidatus Acidoferrales bacterium]|nr:cytochrome P450 [Candidatus Acidoferrales bacterium]
MSISTTVAPEARTDIPKAPFLDTLRALFGGKSQRIDMLSRLQRLHDEKGPVVSQSAGIFQLVNLFGPDANRFVLLDRDDLFSSRKPWMAIMGRIFPNGLLLRDGEEHKQHRKIMHAAFVRPALRQYLERMNPMIARGLDGWRDRRGGFLAFRAFKELTLDIAASIFVGVDLGPETTRMNGVFEDLVSASMSRVRLPIPGLEFHRGLKGREFMVDYFRRLIPQRRAASGDDMFSRLCRAESEEGARFSDADVIDHMVFLMMAAHDTTTSTLTSMTYELARHPAWQERLRDESRNLGKPWIDFDDVEKLDGLTWVMKETLRRYPPLPVIPRVALRDFEWEGFRIPAGAMVVLSPIHTHHMREWWPDPGRFEPERFSPPRAEDEKHTHCWIPFGGGGHLCIGYRFAEVQVKSIMHQMLLGLRWRVPEGYRMPVQQAPISKPLDGLPVFWERLA